MFAIIASMIAVCPFSVSAEDDVNSYETTAEDINISSSNSLGNMLTNEYEQSLDENGTDFSGNMIYEVDSLSIQVQQKDLMRRRIIRDFAWTIVNHILSKN